MTLLAVLETGVPVVAFLLMIAVGLDVTRDDLRQLRHARRMLALGTVAQIVCLPAAALLLLQIAPPEPAVAEYLLLIAACPGGGMSNVYVYLARANTALSVTLTAVSCLLAVFTLPLVMGAYRGLAATGASFDVPLGTLTRQLLIMAVIPVIIGASVRWRWPSFESRHGGRLRAVTAAGVVLIVLVGLLQSAGAMTPGILAGGMVAAGLVIGGMACGWMVGALCAARRADRFTLLVEFAVRNLAIAMVIEVNLLHHPDFIAFGALALLTQAAFLLIAVRLYRRGGDANRA
jgi:bile acid:Na+ symporter, BASS family